MATVEASVNGHPLEAEKSPSLELSAYTEVIGVNGRVWKFRLGEYIPKTITTKQQRGHYHVNVSNSLGQIVH